ncbi:MAG: hypothetical protein L0J18_13750 [Tetragenococcus koreensis]|nr:hypothetical protein [Tetragenococcus koreensis]MDN6268702.1 hypothetical protein [Tetragenococcus koreensis]MDN6835165.1 hypothetical protein [Lactococcus lactis]MDN6839290.1 hypothetical protein [Tetragenococcus halophilus]
MSIINQDTNATLDLAIDLDISHYFATLSVINNFLKKVPLNTEDFSLQSELNSKRYSNDFIGEDIQTQPIIYDNWQQGIIKNFGYIRFIINKSEKFNYLVCSTLLHQLNETLGPKFSNNLTFSTTTIDKPTIFEVVCRYKE